MVINTKFDIDEDVYVIQKRKISTNYKCNICEGKKIVLIKNEPFNCPKCHGTGTIENKDIDDVYEWVIELTKIYRVDPEIINGIQHNRYSVLRNYGWSISEDEIFKTKEEAMAECKRLNKVE